MCAWYNWEITGRWCREAGRSHGFACSTCDRARCVSEGASRAALEENDSAGVPARLSLRHGGVTLWRLRPARASDGPRLLVHEPAGRSSEWTPERVSIDQQLARGDQVRLT